MKKRIIYIMACIVLLTLGAQKIMKCQAAEKDTNIIRIGYFEDNNGFHEGFSDEERKSGYGYEYFQEIAKYTGWKYEYVYGTWSDIYEKMIRGEIDIMGAVSKTDEREKLMLFPEEKMGVEEYYLFVLSDDDRIKKDDLSTLNGKRIGANANSIMYTLFEQFMQENNLDCTLIAYDGHFSCEEALQKGEIDACIITTNYNVNGIKPLIKIGKSDIFIAVNKNRKDILQKIDEVQSEINEAQPYYIEKLQDKYFYQGLLKQTLTEEEKAWISNREFRIGCLEHFLPYSDIQNGKTEGVIGVLAKEISKKLQTQVVCVGYEDYETMKNALDTGNVDMIFPECADLWDAEQKQIIITDPIVSDRNAIVFQGDYDELSYDKIAIARASSSQEDYFKINFPNSEPVYFDTIADCLKAVKKKEVSCTFAASNVLLRYFSENQNINVALHSVMQKDEIAYAIAVRHDEVQLYSVLGKVLAYIDETEINNALVKAAYTEPDYTLALFLKHNAVAVTLFLIGFVVVLVTFILVFVYRTKQHHKEMVFANNMLKNQLEIIKSQENIITVDSLTQVYNRYQLERYTSKMMENYSAQSGLGLYMAIMDLDKFKSINDKYGHQEGDHALVTAAGIMKEACDEQNAFLARYGGDEFVIVCQAKNREVLENICRNIKDKMKETSEQLPYELSISVGIAEYQILSEDFKSFFENADKELYKIKEEKKKKNMQ